MIFRSGLLFLISAFLQSACTTHDGSREALQGVTAIRIFGSGNDGRVVLLEKAEQVEPIVKELNSLRAKKWNQNDVLLRCYASVIVYRKEEKLADFRVSDQYVVDRYINDLQSTNYLSLSAIDIPLLKTELSKLESSGKCR